MKLSPKIDSQIVSFDIAFLLRWRYFPARYFGQTESRAQFTLDDSDRPTRLKQVNPGLCVKEPFDSLSRPLRVVHFPLFPFNGQTFSTAEGVTITQMFQRNTKLDFTFSYTIGQNALRISVVGLSDIRPVAKRIKLLPARFFNRTTDQKNSAATCR